MLKRSERYSFYSHLLGATLTIAGVIVLIAKSQGRADAIIISLIYGVAMFGMFAFSSVYHATKSKENSTSIWRKLDHIAIFFMIAGSYTPMSYIFLDGAWRISIISVVWGLTILGIVLKVFFIRLPRIVSPLLYLMMGWIAIVPLYKLWINVPRDAFILLAGGGIAYSLGAILYALKKPNLFPGTFGFHETFHIFVLVGAILHYIVVLMAIGQL